MATKLNDYQTKVFGSGTKRIDFSKTKHNLEIADLTAIQKESYDWFVKEGIEQAIDSVYPIMSTKGRLNVEYVPGTLRIEAPENEYQAIKECKQKGTTYNLKINGVLRVKDEETGEAKEMEVLFGEIPHMTSGGTFIINGSEKVVVSQILRAPGAYYHPEDDMGSLDLFQTLQLFPKFGSWIDIFRKLNIEDPSALKEIKIKIDKSRGFLLTTFLRALKLEGDTILNFIGNTPAMQLTLEKDKFISYDSAVEHLHHHIRKGDRITADSKKNLLANILFNPKRYNLSKTGRYMLNRKLNLVERLKGTWLAEDIVSKKGETLFKKNTKVDISLAREIQKAFDKKLVALTQIPDVDFEYIYADQGLVEPKLLKETKVALVKVYATKDAFDAKDNVMNVIGNNPDNKLLTLTLPDIIASVSYFNNMSIGLGQLDDRDSLVNKKVSTVGELLQNNFQVALSKLEKHAKERMSAIAPEKVSPKNITNNKAIYNQFKSFFNSSQLSQFMDQMNPLAELANKRRITSMGPGGLSRGAAPYSARTLHLQTSYGRVCPVESPEGPNIGLILNLANFARINEYGFIETPYYPVENGVVVPKPVYLTAFEELTYRFAPSTINLDENNKIKDKIVTARIDGDLEMVPSKQIDFVEVSSRQMTSISTTHIPFLENDDATRALMGANMQRQAVPLLKAEAPVVASGVEKDVALSSASNIKSKVAGKVEYVDSEQIRIKSKEGELVTYELRTFERSNQGSVITQRPIVKVGQSIKKGQLLVDGPSFDNSELALGKNVVVAFTTWNGYNYEDAVILSERLVKEDAYTSLHIEEQSVQFRKSKAGDDILTAEIPNVSNHAKRNLDGNGIVRIGAEVESGDVLVGRVSPKSDTNQSAEMKLLSSILGKRYTNEKDTSLKVKNGHGGTVIDVQVLSRENGDKLQDGIEKIVRVFIAQKRKIKVGDKMAGRHGNKGIVSRILPVEDMPHLEDGTPVDVMLNPQGVPSRMNIGQVMELHLGMVGKALGIKFSTPVFDGAKYDDIQAGLKEAGLPLTGKSTLFDPISDKRLDEPVAVGVMYMIKLAHMIDDKMHARSIGPYSLITQQPLGGKSQNGGQRFGEMETWALEGYGASNVLQEMLTYKSDSIEGRNRLYSAISKGMPIPERGMPESFNVLRSEIFGIGMKLDIERVNDEKEEENA